MKDNFLVLLLLLGLSCQVFGQTPAQGLEGSWQGTLEAGGTKLRLILTVTKSDADAYAAKLESVDQGASIPVDTITVNIDAVRMEMKPVEAVFEGVLNKERTELTGKFTQRGQELPLTFKRGEPAAAMPPKPKPDYSAPADAPYLAEDVVVQTPAGHTLAGTLTLPKGASRAKPVGAIVTVTGSGPQDRDENIGLQGFRPFRQLADALARSGIAVLRMDDRGTGASGGTFKGSTSADFAEDIRAGLAYLRTAARDPGRSPRCARPQRGCSDRADGGRQGTHAACHRAARRHRAARAHARSTSSSRTKSITTPISHPKSATRSSPRSPTGSTR